MVDKQSHYIQDCQLFSNCMQKSIAELKAREYKQKCKFFKRTYKIKQLLLVF